MKINNFYKRKSGTILYQVIAHIILIALVFGLFFIATVERTNSNVVKQQVLEKQTALLIDSATDGMSFTIKRSRLGLESNYIESIELKEGRIFIHVAGLKSGKGYPYFTQNNINVRLTDDEKYFVIEVSKNENN